MSCESSADRQFTVGTGTHSTETILWLGAEVLGAQFVGAEFVKGQNMMDSS